MPRPASELPLVFLMKLKNMNVNGELAGIAVVVRLIVRPSTGRWSVDRIKPSRSVSVTKPAAEMSLGGGTLLLAPGLKPTVVSVQLSLVPSCW
jgi:hypothetical protein